MILQPGLFAEPEMDHERTEDLVVGSNGLLITCEHGGNRIPLAYRDLFLQHQALLGTHRGFDDGALVMAQTLSSTFEAPLVSATISRLLVDLNRSLGHPKLHFETVRSIPSELRQHIISTCYLPYREKVEHLLRQAIDENGRVIHISSHSFTPILDGQERRADIGLLYDPKREDEAAFCARWKACLNDLSPSLIIRRNYPYAGYNDGLTTSLRKRFPASSYLGIEIELNQKHVNKDPRKWALLRNAIVESLRCALAASGVPSEIPSTNR